jgi:hypothetical protein
MMKLRCALTMIALVSLSACGQDDTSDKNNSQSVECSDGERYSPVKGQCEPIPSADMAADLAASDMSTQDMSVEQDLGPTPDMTATPDMTPDMPVEQDMAPDMVAATDATLTGKITRSTAPKAGGKGGLYVAIFERNPITNQNDPGLVARTLIPDADMTAAGASYTYTLGPIPTRAEAYYITAFLDDNNTVNMNDPSKAGPDKGDLVSLDGFNFPTVTVSQPGEETLDIVLNIAMPF